MQCAPADCVPLKLKLRVFSAGQSVAIVSYCVTKILPTCSPMIGQSFVLQFALQEDTAQGLTQQQQQLALFA